MPDHVCLLVEVDPGIASTSSSSRSRDGHHAFCAKSFPGSRVGCRRSAFGGHPDARGTPCRRALRPPGSSIMSYPGKRSAAVRQAVTSRSAVWKAIERRGGPVLRNVCEGPEIQGLDIGLSTMTIVGETSADLRRFAEHLVRDYADIRRRQRQTEVRLRALFRREAAHRKTELQNLSENVLADPSASGHRDCFWRS